MPDSKCLRILVVIADPVWDESTKREPIRLDTGKEWATITHDIKKIPFPVRVDRLPIATDEKPNDALADALSEGAPYSVVHISGHGMKGFLALDDGHGCVHPVDARTLGETFHNQGVQLVVLSTCHSANVADGDLSVADALVESGVPAVIGMTQIIDDRVATKLTAVLYHRLASGLAINKALEEARKVIRHDPVFRKEEGGRKPADDADVPVIKGKPDLVLDLVPIEIGVNDNYPPNNLPRNAYFFGRAEELVQISHELAASDTRVVGISGIGGIGKSSLAYEAAWRCSSQFEGIIYAQATQNTPLTIDTLYDEVRKVLSLGVGSKIPEVINKVSCLLVLDNLHWLSDYEWIPIAEFIRKIDPTCSKVLVTYRSPWKSTVSISGFVERPPLEDLDMPSSINLLLTGRPAPRLSWYQLDDDERKRLIQLAKACRRHPYFLQLAAARLNLQSFERLYDELKELKGEFQEASDRFLADQIALLDSDSKNLFPKLSVFPASFDRQAAAAIGNNGDPVDDALLNLTKLRLLIYSPENERYHFHELTREYSKKSLRSEELGNLNKKHAEYFLQQALAARNILKTEKAIAGVILAESERTNWLTGARFYENQKDWQRVVEYGYAIDDPLEKAGYWNDRIIILKKAVNAAIQLGNKKSISSLQHNLGIAYHQQGDYTTAKKYYEESLEIKKALGDKVGQANSLHQLGLLAQDQGDYTTAKKYYEESLEIKKGFEDKSSISVSFQHLGMLAYVQGDYKTARIYYQKSLEMCIVLADKPCIGASLLHLGMLAQDQGDFYTADKYFQTSLKIFQAFGDKPALSSSLHQLGMLAHAQHDYTTAMKYYQTSLEIIKVLGDKAREAKSLHHLGMLVMDQGDYDTARRYYLKSLKIKRALGDKAGVSKSFHQLGIVAMEDGDYAAARKYYQTSFQIEKELENKVGMAISNVQMALLEEKEGNFSKAFELISLAEQQLGQLNSRYVAQVRGFRERIEREKG